MTEFWEKEDWESDDWKQRREQWDRSVSVIRPQLEGLLKEHLGQRCDEFDRFCYSCQMWRTFDELLENPYND